MRCKRRDYENKFNTLQSEIDRLTKLLNERNAENDKLKTDLKNKLLECDDWKNKYNIYCD